MKPTSAYQSGACALDFISKPPQKVVTQLTKKTSKQSGTLEVNIPFFTREWTDSIVWMNCAWLTANNKLQDQSENKSDKRCRQFNE